MDGDRKLSERFRGTTYLSSKSILKIIDIFERARQTAGKTAKGVSFSQKAIFKIVSFAEDYRLLF